MPEECGSVDKVRTIRAGKFRRYHGEGLKQLLDIRTIEKNIRDMFYVFVGFFQSLSLIRSEKPEVIFIKGGFVGMPIGLAATILRVPYITHDSDAVPGLANRIISKGAALHTVAMPTNVYNYESRKTVQVGVPVSKSYKFVSESTMQAARKKLELPIGKSIVLVTGGGLGAVRLNTAVTKIAKQLTEKNSVHIVHLVGPGNSEKVIEQYSAQKVDPQSVTVLDFAPDLYNYSAASDIIVTRAGATTLTEFAIQAKPCIVIPNANLTGGHQSKNASVLAKLAAIELVEDREVVNNPEVLQTTILDLLNDKKRQQELSDNINKTVIRDSAKKIATILCDSGLGKK